jgi:hypothetical protein
VTRHLHALLTGITETIAFESLQTLATFRQLAIPLLGAEDVQASKSMNSSVKDSVVFGSPSTRFQRPSAREIKQVLFNMKI